MAPGSPNVLGTQGVVVLNWYWYIPAVSRNHHGPSRSASVRSQRWSDTGAERAAAMGFGSATRQMCVRTRLLRGQELPPDFRAAELPCWPIDALDWCCGHIFSDGLDTPWLPKRSKSVRSHISAGRTHWSGAVRRCSDASPVFLVTAEPVSGLFAPIRTATNEVDRLGDLLRMTRNNGYPGSV